MGRRVCAVVCSLTALSCGDDSSSLNGGGSSSSSGSSGDTSSSSGSSGDASTSSSSGSSGGTTAASICVATINGYRKTLGVPPLTEWTTIEPCSDGEAKKDQASGQAHGAFPSCGESAQNECPNWPGTPADGIKTCLDYMWMLGPGEPHHDNMASTQWTKAACGFSPAANGTFWSVQNFK